MPSDVEHILRTHQQLLSHRRLFEPDWQSIGELMLPQWSDIIVQRAPGIRRTDRIYDTTAMSGLDFLAAHMMASVLNFQMQWFTLRMRSLPDDEEASQWLDMVARLMLQEMTDDTSPLPTAVHEMLLSYAGQGTGCLFIDEHPVVSRTLRGFRGVYARALPIGSYAIGEDAGGRVDTVYRELELTPRQAAQQFGVEMLSGEMQKTLSDPMRESAQHTPHVFIHAVFPRDDHQGQDAAQPDMPWASVYVDRQHKHTVSEGGYRWMPYMVPRWLKLSAWSPWGFGRGHMALPEARTLNAIDQDSLRALSLHIFPPGFIFGANAETVGRISLMPGALNPIATNGTYVPYVAGGSFSVEQLKVEERRARIRSIFFQDLLQTLPLPDDPGSMTATEVLSRTRQMQQLMGPAFMRLLSELLNPLIDVVFSILLHAQVIPPPPDVVIETAQASGGRIDVEYEGPLARAQRSDEIGALDEGLSVGVRLVRELGDPLLLQNIDLDETYRRLLKAQGFPDALLRDRRFVRQLRAQAEQQAQQQAQLDQAAQGAQAAGQAAPALQALQGGAANG